MAAERDYIRKWAGILGLVMSDLATNYIRAMRVPTNAVIDDGADIEKITGTDSLGRETVIGNNVKSYKPVLTLTYSGANLDIYALQRGRYTNRATFNSLVLPKEMRITQSVYNGAPSGKVGFGIATDTPTQASTLGDNLDTIQLTQQPFGTFDATILDSFAIGANFARKFSNDLVSAGRFVHIATPFSPTTSARYVSEDSLGPQAINMLVRSTNDTVTLVRIPSAQVDPSGSKFDPKADNIEVKFDISGLGVCEPYQIFELSDTVYCDN